MNTRKPAVAGMFYPTDARVLRAEIGAYLNAAERPPAGVPKALIAPHAGYVYSGPIAASAFRQLEAGRSTIRRVVLLGPCHRVYLEGMAFPSADRFATPLGEVMLDRQAIEGALSLPDTCLSDEAHALEHCLEVQLPFLQYLLDDFELIPFVVGRCDPDSVARVLETLWGGLETLIVVSSDLSHYESYEQASAHDSQTSRQIVSRLGKLNGEDACGAYAINGLMQVVRDRALHVQELDLRNSGDTAGDRKQVVGYGAYAVA